MGRILVSVIDENSPTTGRAARLDISRAVANHNAIEKVDAMHLCGTDQHSWLRFPAVAAIRIIMGTHVKVIEA
jgi:hypothetical protein